MSCLASKSEQSLCFAKCGIVLFFALSIAFAQQTGFVVYSEGHAHKRTLMLKRFTDGKFGKREKICERGGFGGDIQAQISFDGKWVAFARSLQGTSDRYGGNDYHDFHLWDIYIVPIDGKLPANPLRVGHGYWPSWGSDSYTETKTLYYSVQEARTVRAVTIHSNGKITNDREHLKWPSDALHFTMCSPDGNFIAARNKKAQVEVFHMSGPRKGQRYAIRKGCHPHITADSRWIVHAKNSLGRADGTVNREFPVGQYHFGSSQDLRWLVSCVTGDASEQNRGNEVVLWSLDTSHGSFGVKRETRVTRRGSWVDVHTIKHDAIQER